MVSNLLSSKDKKKNKTKHFSPPHHQLHQEFHHIVEKSTLGSKSNRMARGPILLGLAQVSLEQWFAILTMHPNSWGDCLKHPS